jgi:hypothetical protein
LPIIALSMTSMVAQNMKLREEENLEVEEQKEPGEQITATVTEEKIQDLNDLPEETKQEFEEKVHEELKPSVDQEHIDALKDFASKFKQEDIPADIAKVTNENFWNLIGDDKATFDDFDSVEEFTELQEEPSYEEPKEEVIEEPKEIVTEQPKEEKKPPRKKPDKKPKKKPVKKQTTKKAQGLPQKGAVNEVAPVKSEIEAPKELIKRKRNTKEKSLSDEINKKSKGDELLENVRPTTPEIIENLDDLVKKKEKQSKELVQKVHEAEEEINKPEEKKEERDGVEVLDVQIVPKKEDQRKILKVDKFGIPIDPNKDRRQWDRI